MECDKAGTVPRFCFGPLARRKHKDRVGKEGDCLSDDTLLRATLSFFVTICVSSSPVFFFFFTLSLIPLCFVLMIWGMTAHQPQQHQATGLSREQPVREAYLGLREKKQNDQKY